MDYQYYNAPQSYPQTPVQDGFNQRRPSSSGSHPQPQGFSQQTFQPQVGGLEFGPQYAFDQANDWAHTHVGSADFPTSGAGHFDVTELSGYTRSEREPPWDPSGRTQARTVDDSLQLRSPDSALYIPKAYTVAGAAYPSPAFRRPSLGPRPRQSYASIPDSGYGSQPTVADSIPGLTQAQVKDIEFPSSHPPPQSVTEAPPRALSVKTEPIGSGSTKRRRSKSFIEKCRLCPKELKNKSEAL